MRLQTPSEAMRLIRMWHRTRFIPKKYPVESVGDRYIVSAQLLY